MGISDNLAKSLRLTTSYLQKPLVEVTLALVIFFRSINFGKLPDN